jgi:hypothetical protein
VPCQRAHRESGVAVAVGVVADPVVRQRFDCYPIKDWYPRHDARPEDEVSFELSRVWNSTL